MSRLSFRLVFLESFTLSRNNLFQEGRQRLTQKAYIFIGSQYPDVPQQPITAEVKNSKQTNDNGVVDHPLVLENLSKDILEHIFDPLNKEQDGCNRKNTEFECVNTKFNRDEQHYKMLNECLDILDKAKKILNDARVNIHTVNERLIETRRVVAEGHFDIDLFFRRLRRWLRQVLNNGIIKWNLFQKAYIFIDSQYSKDSQITTVEESSKETNDINKHPFVLENQSKDILQHTSHPLKKEQDWDGHRYKMLNECQVIEKKNRTRDFKRNLVKSYDYKRPERKARCMMTNKLFPSKYVVGAHLFPRSKQRMAKILLDIDDIDDVRNGLLLLKPIEWAFDHRHIAFVNRSDQYVMKVFNPKYINIPIIDCFPSKKEKEEFLHGLHLSKNCEEDSKKYPECVPFMEYDLQTTFGDLDGRPLVFSNKNTTIRPYKRCLDLQAMSAYHRSLELGYYMKSNTEDEYIFKHFLSKMFHQITKSN